MVLSIRYCIFLPSFIQEIFIIKGQKLTYYEANGNGLQDSALAQILPKGLREALSMYSFGQTFL